MMKFPTVLTPTGTDDPVTLAWIRSLPKAELHLHLLGAIRPETAFDLAAKHRIDFPAVTREDWKRTFVTGDLATFVEAFIALFELAQEAADFERVAWEVFQDLASDGIRYAEPRLTLTSHLSRGVSIETLVSGLLAAVERARGELDLEIAWIVDFPRVLGEEVARLALREAIRGQTWGVVGLDVAGYEGVGASDQVLSKVFREARSNGLRTTAHAGEIGNAAHVWTALLDFEVDRIGHGLRAMEDDTLVEELARRRFPIETNPTCNVLLGAVDSLEHHPLEVFRKRGIPISINTDDPSLFGITLSEEILRVSQTFNWDRSTVSKVVRNAWDHRFRQP